MCQKQRSWMENTVELEEFAAKGRYVLDLDSHNLIHATWRLEAKGEEG